MPPLRIFISYGRDQYAPLAAKLAEDLTAKGYEVWFDQELQSGRSWARDIQRQLDWLAEIPKNGRFIFLLSQHSTREDSFCLSELQVAIDNHVPIFPILLETCKIPIEIYPLQRLDLRPCLPVEDHPAEYQHLLQSLISDMAGQIESRLAQQRIIEDQTPRQVAPQQQVPKPGLRRNILRSLFNSRIGCTVTVTILSLLVMVVIWQGPLLMAPPPMTTPTRISVTQSGKPPPSSTPLPSATQSLSKTLLAPTLLTTATITIPRTLLPLTSTPILSTTNTPPICTTIGQTWKSPIDGMILVCVPAGEFQMGSTDADKSASPNEKPQHTVTLDAYWIDQTEVTSAMFAAFLNQKGNQTEAGSSWYFYTYGEIAQVNGIWKTTPGFDQHPVTGMNWYGAKAYCAWAGRQLPSEAQWEKAARGTDNRLYPWGNQLPNNTLANYQEAKGNTTAVKSYESGKNPYGLYDMAGNVSEWVEDWFGETYYQSQSTWRNPTGPADGGIRILRGGGWTSGYDGLAVELRSTFRGWGPPDARDGTIGFRCSR